ncbi:MAG: transporter substrate-binding domain-containing protein [Clostridiales bacterium]|nr:transporter substrate-binding domain-containing protein [Clostridiales bacterium]MBQ5966819.1 transporter substrate-binding domain-containing protein [Clostridiales bacterium]MBQ6272195.1 transporter substrate-binding domain-containing protein [Clostridiales bacterium]
MKKVIAKIISLGLVLGMAGAMAACTSKKGTTVKSGTLTMATNAYFPPYEYYEGTDIVGIDAEIAAAIAEKLDLKLEIVDVEFDSIIAGVQSNKYDIGMAGMTVTDERKKAVNFSSTYATGIQAVIVPEGSEITDVDTLLGGDYKVGVQQGTTGDIYMTDDVGEDRVVRFSKGNDAVLALSTGKVDAVVIDNEPAKSFVAANAGLVILPTAYVEEEYAMCINKDNKDLLEKINKALEELTADGTIDKIIEKYIPSNG